MKYVAVLDTDDYEDFGFFEDGKEKYLHAVDAYATNGEWIYLPFKPLEQEPTTKDDLGVDREDAVERLNALKQFIGYDKDSEIVKATQKSLDMAIKALEHPEKNVIAVVPCGDAISRQAVLDLMMHIWGENFSGDSAMQESIDAIRALPSVTPQEPILDNIRAEIEARLCDVVSDYTDGYRTAIQGNLAILDKYKAESEG